MTSETQRIERRDLGILLVLLALAFVYYGSYARSGFNAMDEGYLLLTSQRLAEGGIPHREVGLGYGYLWFLPFVLLHKLLGFDFLAVRLLFLFCALTTTTLAFCTMVWSGRMRGAALAAALLVLIVPGTLHKGFIPLIIVGTVAACSWTSSPAGPAAPWSRGLLCGLVPAVAWQLRPDVGLVLAAAAVLHLATTPAARGDSRGRAVSVVTAMAPLIGLTVVVGAIAHQQGWARQYWEYQYNPVTSLVRVVRSLQLADAEEPRAGKPLPVQPAGLRPDGPGQAVGFAGSLRGGVGAEPVRASVPAKPVTTTRSASGGLLARQSPLSLLRQGGTLRRSLLGIWTLLAPALLVLGLIVSLRGWLRARTAGNGRRGARPEERSSPGSLSLVAWVACLAAFPQFILFRPDSAHLSQFMPGFVVAFGLTWGHLRGRLWSLRLAGTGLLAGSYLWLGGLAGDMGTAALGRGRTEWLETETGMRFRARPGEARSYRRVLDQIGRHTSAEDWLLTFPYDPGLNVLSGRRTFARHLYIDDTIDEANPNWQLRMVRKITTYRPKMIIVSNRPINGTEASRFLNWADRLVEVLEQDYRQIDHVGPYHLYVQADAAASAYRFDRASARRPSRQPENPSWRAPVS